MADFCLQCSLELFDKYHDDLSDLGGEQKIDKEGYGWPCLCEGCGSILVDDHGVCIVECLKDHHIPPKWVEDHITYDMKSKEFIAWDETQSQELGRSTSKKEMIALCWRQAAKLAEERDE